jgi:hypothetical protein
MPGVGINVVVFAKGAVLDFAVTAPRKDMPERSWGVATGRYSRPIREL